MKSCFAVFLGYRKISADLASYGDAIRWARDFADRLDGNLPKPLSVHIVPHRMDYIGRVDFNGNFVVAPAA